MSSTKFVFFGPIGKTRWPPWPLIGWDIVDFSSETAERNSTKTWQEARSQRPLPSFCFLGRSEKQDGRPGRSAKKVAHCTQVHDMWPLGPLVLGHLPFSNILPYSPDFYMFLPYSPDFYMFTSWMCNLHHVHLGQGNKMQLPIWMTYLWYFESLHSAEVFYSHFKICFNNFIYPPWVDYFTLGWWLFEYLLASTVNFKIYIFKIN